MPLISEAYKAINLQLHQDRPDYGMTGQKWAPMVLATVKKYGLSSVLDYGAGKSTLRNALPPSYWERGFIFTEYDPAVPGIDTLPSEADLVVCTDVLEHIEPDCLTDVLEDIKRLARKYVILNASTIKAEKTLSDGRNAHLIVEPAHWWLQKFEERWRMKNMEGTTARLFFFGATR